MWLLLTKSSLLIKSQESAIQAPKIKKNTRIFSMVTVFESSAEKTRKKKKKKHTHKSDWQQLHVLLCKGIITYFL